MVYRAFLYIHDPTGMASGQKKHGGGHFGVEPGAGFFWRKYVGRLWDCLIEAIGVHRKRHGDDRNWCGLGPDGEA